MAGNFQAKKGWYAFDMEGFWLCDNYRIIADIATSALHSFQIIFSGVNRFLLISLPPVDPPL